MLKVTKQQSLIVQAIVFLMVGMLCLPIFQALTKWLGGLIWPWSPWGHWYGWATYTFIWIYALIVWAFSWVSQYVLWFTPIMTLMVVVITIKERNQLEFEGYKKVFLFQTRQLAKTWRKENGFGNDQLKAFLNVAHLALSAGVNKKDLQMWFLLGFRQGNKGADQILEDNEFELLYRSTEGGLATQPELWTKGKPCLVH